MAKTRDEATRPRGKSRYAKKLARKHGRGSINPNWMWWFGEGRSTGISTVV